MSAREEGSGAASREQELPVEVLDPQPERGGYTLRLRPAFRLGFVVPEQGQGDAAVRVPPDDAGDEIQKHRVFAAEQLPMLEFLGAG